MNLIDVLLFQDRRQLVTLLNVSGNNYNRNSKRELIEQLYPKLMNSHELANKYQQLSNNAKRIALSLCYDKKLFLSKEEINGFDPSVSQEKITQIIEELVSAGILYSYIGKNYLIPKQIKKGIIFQVSLVLKEQRLIMPINNDISDEIDLINDTFSFIDTLAERKLPLTKNGIIHKKDFQQIMKLFTVVEALPNDKWRFGYGRRFSQYPDRFSLIYDFCFYKDWIREYNGYLCLGDAVDELDNMKMNEFMIGFVQFWLKTYRRPIPVISLLFNIFVEVISKEEGLEEDTIVYEFNTLVEEYYFDSKEDIIKKRFLEMLNHLNIVKKIRVEGINCYCAGPAIKYFLK